MRPAPVLAATDLSDASDEALRQAAAAARAAGAPLAVCHVVPDPVGIRALFPDRHAAEALSVPKLVEAATAALRERVARVVGKSPEVAHHVVVGEAYAELVRLASELGASRVVVASRGRGALARALLGSVAERVVELAPCEVLVARPSPKGPVLAATDLSEPAEAALRAAAREAATRDAALVALYVSPVPAPGFVELAALVPEGSLALAASQAAELEQAPRAVIESAVARLGVRAEVVIARGAAKRELVREAEERGASLLVVGSHGRTGLARLLIGSTAAWAVRHAGCSVLVAR